MCKSMRENVFLSMFMLVPFNVIDIKEIMKMVIIPRKKK